MKKKFDIGKMRVNIGYKFYLISIWDDKKIMIFIIPKFCWSYI
ncbi:unnamed protein product [marine sediment metagenome]|uniref:Uncharacterized protein n=1 Tax=marine sediment metagenome TaxID=412755 RepID=X1CUX7_9ZZZZ